MRSSLATQAAVVLAVLLASAIGRAARATAALEKELERAGERLGEGFERDGEIVTGGLAEGQSTRIARSLRAGTCYRFLAVGGDGIDDLDLRVLAGGRQLGADSGKVSSPEVKVCAKRDLRVEARLRLYEGSGQYAFGVWREAGAEAASSPGREAVLDELEGYAGQVAAGMEAVGEPHFAEVGYRHSEVVRMKLDGRRCYKFVAVADEGVNDLRMSVLADGEEVAGDRISGRRPVAQWCAPERTDVEIRLLVTGGSGRLALGVYGVSSAASDAAPEKVGGPESDFVANRIRQLHVQYGRGRAAISPVFRGNLSTNGEQVFEVRLQAGHCYTVIAAGNPSVKDIDVVLLDRSGSEIQRDDTRSGFTALDTDPCPRFTGRYTVEIEMKRGFGQFGAQVFSD
ncbi:MAG: hypothetical protein R6V85_12180 [Polyangia bacterium]